MVFCRFEDHIYHMFGPDVPPASWDLDKKYKPENLLVRFTIFMNPSFCLHCSTESIDFLKE